MSLRFLVGAAGVTAAILMPSIAATASPASPVSVSASTPTAPSAPRTPAIAPGHGKVIVTWTAPATTGGSPVLAYRIRVTPGRVVTVAAPATSAVITGLADGTQVTAAVAALNKIGVSPAVTAGSAIPTPPVSTVLTATDDDNFGDLVVDTDGTIYLAKADSIVMISPDGTLVTPLVLGPVEPLSIALAPDGDLYWLDGVGSSRYTVKRIHDAQIQTVAGNLDPEADFTPKAEPVPALEAVLATTLDLAINPVDGSVFLVDDLCGVVERFTVGGNLEVVAGSAGSAASCGPNPISDGDGGPATAAHLAGPQGLAIDDTGAVYVAETRAHRVRKFTVGGTISTVAGDGTQDIDPAADLPATATGVPWPSRMAWAPGRGLVIDALGRERLLVGDRLRRLGDDAYDRAVTAMGLAPPGEGPLAANDATLTIDWSGSTLRVISLVPRDGGGWHRVIKAVGPWLPASDPVDHPGFGSWADLVKLHHRAFVDRAPTTDQLNAWVAALDFGTKTPGQLDDALRRSAENTTNVDPVVRLYRAFLGRAPDAGGLRYWIARKRNVAPARRWTVGQMAAQFAASSEFQRKYGALSNRAFVTRIYTDVLGRPADTAGVDFWTRRLDTKRQTRAQVMVGFSESSEYRRKQASTTDVAIAYLALVGRMPTATETTAWVDAAAGGKTHIELLDDLVEAAPHLL